MNGRAKFWHLLPPAIVALVVSLSSRYGVLLTIGVAVMVIIAFTSTLNALRMFVVVLLVKYLNPALWDPSQYVPLAFWVIALATWFHGVRSHVLVKVLVKHWVILVFAAAMMAAAPIVSPLPLVSALKALSFAVISMGLLICVRSLCDHTLSQLLVWIETVYVFALLGSLLTLFDQDIAFALNGTGFQGIINHPQSYGTWLVPMVLYWIYRTISAATALLFFRNLLLALIGAGTLVACESRTGAIAVLFGFLVGLPSALRFIGRDTLKLSAFALFSIVLLAGSILGAFSLTDPIRDFAFKRQSKTLDDALSSRSGGAASQYDSFLDSPILGHGFGVYPSGYQQSDVTKIVGIPVSAPVEKGFLPTAVLEDGGLIGALLAFWLIASLAPSRKTDSDAIGAGVYWGCIAINLGEYVIFYPSGVGAVLWLWVGISLRLAKTSDGRYTSRRNMHEPSTGIPGRR